MTNHLDPSAIAEGVRGKIQLAIADLLPPDVWAALVKKEVDAFLSETTEVVGYGYGDRRTVKAPSGLGRVVRSVMEEETRKRLADMLASPDWSTHWDGANHVAGEAVKKAAVECAPRIMETVVAEMMQRMVAGMRPHG